jgi:photosystem II stability/assembly factor-like uncharacterized protein
MAAENLGSGVSYVFDPAGFNYDEVVFQKGKPPLDSELNLMQELQNAIAQKGLSNLPSGWISLYPFYTDKKLSNQFYTQNPTGALPELALVNGKVIKVTNTNTQIDNVNIIDLGDPPQSGNWVNGVFLEVWRALLDPNTVGNPAVKPDPAVVIDTFRDIFMFDVNNGWVVGDNGLVIGTKNGGQSWSIQTTGTQRQLNGVHFITTNIGWVVGNSGVVARTSSGGQGWTILTQATASNLTSVFAVSQLVVWAVGDSGTILNSTNGVSFSVMPSVTTTNLRKVYFLNSSIGWIVGENGLILKTVNGGQTWGIAVSGTTENLNSIFFYDSNFGFAVGDNGTILRSSDGGSSWVSQSGNVVGGAITEDLKDVNMVPTLDRLVTGEEVSSQLGPFGLSFTTLNKPITIGDGKGTVTNNPASVTVMVDGTKALVDSVNGNSGFVLLNSAPGSGAITKITYNYRSDSAVFEGKAWIVGSGGHILDTTNIGQTWNKDTTTGYGLNAASFVTQKLGWVCGAESKILATTNGTDWYAQSSSVFPVQMQRDYLEGNINGSIIPEDVIHPDAKIETSKRVQVQYSIRVLPAVDPDANPEAGLSSTITGLGPNASGSFTYQNMGTINGDYGCWRAQCLNTVDGYCYAIPMFFVNRRNSGDYNLVSNPNGTHVPLQPGKIRPDLLLATNVVDNDILDVRRKIIFSDTGFLSETFNALSANTLRSAFGHTSAGTGTWYGTELLQTDRIGGSPSDGGTDINSSIADAAAGKVSSASDMTTLATPVPAGGSVPGIQPLFNYGLNGIFNPDNIHYLATYDSINGTNGKSIPGSFSNLGTSDPKFTFNSNTDTNPQLHNYILSGDFITDSTESLSYIPSDPQLVNAYNSSVSFYYQGVLDSTVAKVIETWDSGIPGYIDYALAYPIQDISNSSQQNRASPVELHSFIQVSNSSTNYGGMTSILIGTDLHINPKVYPDGTGDADYNILTISKINNITAGFSHKIQSVLPSPSDIDITPATGYGFIKGAILEIISYVKSAQSATNTRNGAAVNFTPRIKSLNNFTRSDTTTAFALNNYIISYPSSTDILGWSVVETVNSLTQPVCWDTVGMKAISINRQLNLSSSIQLIGSLVGDATVQLTLRDTDLSQYTGLLVSYNRIPSQCQSLPNSLTFETVKISNSIYVSNLGTGGGTTGIPFENPLVNIPTNGSADDNLFTNFLDIQLSNYFTDTGFVGLPVTVPGDLESILTLSSPTTDNAGRSYYLQCSSEVIFVAEGLKSPIPRKIYLPIIAQVRGINSLFENGEYILIIFSRYTITEKENITGFFNNGNCTISVYRLPNRPISLVKN